MFSQSENNLNMQYHCCGSMVSHLNKPISLNVMLIERFLPLVEQIVSAIVKLRKNKWFIMVLLTNKGIVY